MGPIAFYSTQLRVRRWLDSIGIPLGSRPAAVGAGAAAVGPEPVAVAVAAVAVES